VQYAVFTTAHEKLESPRTKSLPVAILQTTITRVTMREKHDQPIKQRAKRGNRNDSTITVMKMVMRARAKKLIVAMEKVAQTGDLIGGYQVLMHMNGCQSTTTQS
jgi:hypothetical protein